MFEGFFLFRTKVTKRMVRTELELVNYVWHWKKGQKEDFLYLTQYQNQR